MGLTRFTATALTVFLLATAPGCGESQDGKGGVPNYESALRGAPPRLAKLYGEANQLLPGERDAFEDRLSSLRGFPVVANLWASWCGGCREEFPMLQEMSARYGSKIAFLGVDSLDAEAEANEWLEANPVPYPSYSDPDQSIKRSLGALGLPSTAFFDREGDLVWLKQGAYLDMEDLEADIRQFALPQHNS